jgi:peptidoglycan biosynthesis protein MviN/MurJ (putative lipid II flippase)
MSLTTDALGLGAAFAITVGSAIQARQAFAQLNEETPLKTSVVPLVWAALLALYAVLVPQLNQTTVGTHLANLGLGKVAGQGLTGAQVKDLKNWLGWFLGWFFITIGAMVALAGAVVMLVNDL